MISSQNAILNQFVFPMALSGDLKAGQVLVYDASTRKFVNADANTLDVERKSGVDDIKYWATTTNALQSGFIIPWKAASKQSLIITLDGVKQDISAYELTALGDETMVTFVENVVPDTGVEFIGLITEDPESVKHHKIYANGSDTYSIPWVAHGVESLFIYMFGGLKQQLGSFNISVFSDHTEITFAESILLGEEIEVIGITGTYGTGIIEEIRGNNLGFGGAEVFKDVTSAGAMQILNFRQLVPGSGITFNVTSDFIEINNLVSSFSNVGAGAEFLVDPLTTDLQFRTLTGGPGVVITQNADEIEIAVEDVNELGGLPALSYSTTLTPVGNGASLIKKGLASPDHTFQMKTLLAGQGIILTELNDELVISNLQGGAYKKITATVYNMIHTDAIIGVQQIGTIINLCSASAAGPGKRIIIKDEAGNANSTTPIVINASLGQTIEGTLTTHITQPYGFVELYSDGAGWFKL